MLEVFLFTHSNKYSYIQRGDWLFLLHVEDGGRVIKRVCISLHFPLTRCNPWASIFPYYTSQVSIFFSKGLFLERQIRGRKLLKCKLELGEQMGLNTAGSELQQPSVLVFTSITWGVFIVLPKAHEDCLGKQWKDKLDRLISKTFTDPIRLLISWFANIMEKWKKGKSILSRLDKIQMYGICLLLASLLD